MKRVKALFVFGIIIGLVAIGIGIMPNKFVVTSKKTVSEDSEYDKFGSAYLHLNFYKYDQNKNFLAGTKFKLSSYNNVYKLYPSEEYYEHDTVITGSRYYSSEYGFDNSYSVLSERQKEAVSKINTTADFKALNNGKYVYCDNYFFDGQLPERDTGYYCTIPVPTVFYLEETKVPSGYAKTKVLVPGTIDLIYYIKDFESDNYGRKDDTYYRVEDYFGTDSYDVMLIGINIQNYNSYIEYGDVDESVLLGTDVEEAYELMYEYSQGTACSTMVGSSYEPGKVDFPIVGAPFGLGDYRSLDYCYFSLFNEKGTINLEINTTVNDKNAITTTSNNKIQYKVNVKNTGTVDAVDTLVVSKLPEGFQYVENTASNGGIYNASDNTITWDIARLRVANDTTLTYEAYIPNGVSGLNSYIGEAYAESFGMNQRVESNKTVVNLLLNPKTSAPVYGIVITLLIAWGVAGYLFLYKKYFMKHKRHRRKAA